MQADDCGEDATVGFVVLGSETRMSFPPAPPSPPPPPEKRYVAVIAVAIATGILVVGSRMLFVGTAPGDAEPNVAADAADIFVFELDGSNMRNLTESNDWESASDWGPQP
jgi:hypothetical protein